MDKPAAGNIQYFIHCDTDTVQHLAGLLQATAHANMVITQHLLTSYNYDPKTLISANVKTGLECLIASLREGRACHERAGSTLSTAAEALTAPGHCVCPTLCSALLYLRPWHNNQGNKIPKTRGKTGRWYPRGMKRKIKKKDKDEPVATQESVFTEEARNNI